MAHSSSRSIRRACFLLILCVVLAALPELALVAARPESPGNLAADASLRSSNTVGILPWLARGPVPEDGSPWETARVVVLGDRVGRIQLDFGEPVEITALLLQADYDDEYQVRASSDADRWSPVWQVPTAAGSGLRTRHSELPQPVRARYLDVRNAEDTSGKASAESVISAIRVYSTPPDGWRRPGAGGAAGSAGFPWLTSRGVDIAKVVLASLGVVLVVLLWMLDRRAAADRPKRLAKQLLLAVSIAAALGWWNFFQLTSERHGQVHRNYWDVYHYYLGSKYSRELGYTNLYRCHLAAEVEAGLADFQLRRPFTRDLSSNDLVRTPQALDDAAQCREQFSAQRWQAFEQDHTWFRSKLPPSIWLHMPQDHGYNASPVFAILGGALSNLAPMSDLAFVLWISIDTLLLVGMGWLIWSSFGWRASCAAGVFFATNLVAGNHFTAGAFLRQDWLFLVVAGICCLKREKMALAGFLLVYAASLRLFPGFLLLGVALKALVDMLARRSWLPTGPHRRLAAGALAGGIVLMTLSFAVAGRATVWNEFAANTAKHHATPQVQNVGMRALVHHIDRPDIRERPFVSIVDIEQSYASRGRRQLATALALLFLPLLVVAVAAEQDWVAAILGITWLPFVTDINNYYWSLLLIFALLLVRRPIIALGFSAITVLFAALGLAYGYRGLAMFTWSSLALVLFFLWVAILFAGPKLREGWGEWRRGGWRAVRERLRAGAYSM